jgi:tyrosine-protein phosphatase SIW14
MQNHPHLSVKRPSGPGLASKAMFSCLLAFGLILPAFADAPSPAQLEESPLKGRSSLPGSVTGPSAQAAAPITAASAAAAVTAATPAATALEKPPKGLSLQAAMVPALSGAALAADISNFEVVSQELWRGAQPSSKAIAKLAESGVKPIIDLRYKGRGGEAESQVAQKNGIKYVNIPLGFENPTVEDVARFMAIVSQPANQPVFVHCRQGADRTGAAVGIFRILHDRWSFAQAYNEMRSHHFKPWLGNLKSLVIRCGVDPKVSKEISDMAARLEEPVTVTRVSTRPHPTSI